MDEQLRRWLESIGHGIKYAAPDAFGSPALEAVVERLYRTVGGECVDPADTALLMTCMMLLITRSSARGLPRLSVEGSGLSFAN